MTFTLPGKVERIIDILMNAGFEAYAVGGCVRDLLLERKPDDWDITTNARPEQVKKLFKRTVDTGIKHGTVTVLMGGESFEVTTYRIDGEYEDSRHPKEVTYTSDLIEDLKRRDFTINAMAYNSRDGLIDAFGGTKDLEGKIIRAVGDAKERFGEDALRILRAFRFSAQLGFTIEEETLSAAGALADTLQKISAERIRTEFTKLIISKHPERLRDLYQAGITAVILPEFDVCMETEQKSKHHLYTVGEHTIHALMVNARYTDLATTEPLIGKYICYALLFHDFGKPQVMTEDDKGYRHFKGHAEVSEKMARDILRRLKMDNDTISQVAALVKYHDYRPEATPKSVRKAIHKVGEDTFRMLFSVKMADTLAQSQYKRQEKLDYEKKMMDLYVEIIRKKDCVSLKDLAVNGNDLIRAGIKPGKEIGEKLNELLELVLEDPECNTKEYLLSKLS